MPKRFEVYWTHLDPTQGSEIKKVRPAVIVSPDEINSNLRTVIIAPLTTGGKLYPTRISTNFDGKEARVALDQIRTVDKSRLGERMGVIDPATGQKILAVLREMFMS